MEVELITKKDLQEFRLQLLSDIRELLETCRPSGEKSLPVKPWLKNAEVLDLLHISTNTLQRLRIAGKLRSTKVGGVHYYRYEDIERLLNGAAFVGGSTDGKGY